MRETNGNFDSCNSCKRLVPSRLHVLHESEFPFVSRIEFIRSKLSNFSAHVSGVIDINCIRPCPVSSVTEADIGARHFCLLFRRIGCGYRPSTWSTRRTPRSSTSAIGTSSCTCVRAVMSTSASGALFGRWIADLGTEEYVSLPEDEHCK